MVTFQRLLSIGIGYVILSTCVYGQKQAIAPRDSVKLIINGKKILINYGKPSIQGRKIFGRLVPFYKIWRTGNGLATTLTTEADLEMDGAIVPKGRYTLYSFPTEERWKFIINKQTGQWGTVYNPQLDLAQIDVIPKTVKSPIEELTFKLENSTNGNGLLKIEWERTQIVIPFHVSSETLIPSPRDSVTFALYGKRITIDYGRPSMRGRKIVGGVVPYGQVWRTGANAATGFETTADLVFDSVRVPKGTYTLYTLPSVKGWNLIINKQTGQWGTVYNRKLDLVRIPLRKTKLTHQTEKFTIILEHKKGSHGILKLSWEHTELSVNFRVQ